MSVMRDEVGVKSASETSLLSSFTVLCTFLDKIDDFAHPCLFSSYIVFSLSHLTFNEA